MSYLIRWRAKPVVIPLLLMFGFLTSGFGQQNHYYQTDFTKAELAQRRAALYEAVGSNAMVVLQGAAGIPGFTVFRQSNNFYYFTGIESAHAYLLMNGRTKTATVYLPHRDEGMERSQGKVLSAEDAELVKELTGIENVKGYERLSTDIMGAGVLRPPAQVVYLDMSPQEIGNDSRDELLAAQARSAADPWDGRMSNEASFMNRLAERIPQLSFRDVAPIIDSMRTIKSASEIALIRKATQIAGLAIMEAMRSTAPGVYEYQLDAAAKYVFYMHGARGDAYPSIIGGGTNAYMGHYFHKKDVLKNGDLVLMDYAPDYRYYTSDVTRIWPVNGKYTDEQKELYNFIVAYRDALFKYIKPGVTSGEVLDKAAADMTTYAAGKKFVKPAHLQAVQDGLKFRGHFQHPVGMAVHDVGRVSGVPLKPGMVFTIDPMIWIHAERLYIRIEDVAVVTETGVENLSAFVPSRIEEIEALIKEKGLIDMMPAKTLPLK